MSYYDMKDQKIKNCSLKAFYQHQFIFQQQRVLQNVTKKLKMDMLESYFKLKLIWNILMIMEFTSETAQMILKMMNGYIQLALFFK